MTNVSPIAIYKIKCFFRMRNINASVTLRNGNVHMHLAKNRNTHTTRFSEIVTEGLDKFWSGYTLVESNSIEKIVWLNPTNVYVISDNPEMAFKLGMHYKEIFNEFRHLHIERNHALRHIVLRFDNANDVSRYKLKYS